MSKGPFSVVESPPKTVESFPQNRLLAALPPSDWDRLRPAFDIVPLVLKALLHNPGEAIDYVYFPGGGFCSIVTVLEDGNMVEVATIGREGMVGVTASADGNPSTAATMVQGESETCYRMGVRAFRGEMEAHGAFYILVSRYTEAHLGVVMQSVACNALHRVEHRLARWLLMAHDRVEADRFPLTQEFAAMMLGAARPTVSIAAAALQTAGLISYRHGHVTILNRENLERASCECYQTGTKLVERVFAPSSQRDQRAR
jgi:CRP-like cAMP-binding protein